MNATQLPPVGQHLVSAVLCSVLLLVANPGRSATFGEGVLGAGCVPWAALTDHFDVLDVDEDGTNGGYYSEAATGESSYLDLFCPLHLEDGSLYTTLRVWASDASSGYNWVAATAYKFDRTSGYTTVIDTSANACYVQTDDSGYQEYTDGCSHTADNGRYVYYVQVTVKRTSTNVVRFWGVQLTDD